MIETSNGCIHPIMIVGNDNLTYSIVCGLLTNDCPVVLLTTDRDTAVDFIDNEVGKNEKLSVLADWPDKIGSNLVILITPDKEDVKMMQIRQIEERVSEQAIVAVNMESLSLKELQTESLQPSRLFGLNWAYPAHQTFFAEIITHPDSDEGTVEQLKKWVAAYWNKDPYIVRKGFSIRARMMAAMLREALYLVENDFASIESVDRACRNDAGYYLPFAGNFRYMDLMGTYAYGMVMKDLNRELSNSTTLSPILKKKKDDGAVGMDTGKGFYTYSSEEKARWENVFKEFSKEIRQLITKYSHETFDS